MFRIDKVSGSESGFELFVLHSYSLRSVFGFELKYGKRWYPNLISSVFDPNPSLIDLTKRLPILGPIGRTHFSKEKVHAKLEKNLDKIQPAIGLGWATRSKLVRPKVGLTSMAGRALLPFFYIFFKNIFYRNIFLDHNLQFYTPTALQEAYRPSARRPAPCRPSAGR